MVETTMATVDVDFVIVEGSTSVRSRGWSSDGGLAVVLDIFVAFNSCPGARLDFKEPAVVQTGGLIGVTAEDEDLLLVLVGHCDVLRPWPGERFTVAVKFGPSHLL